MKESRLAATGGPHDAEELAGTDVQVDVVDGQQAGAGIGLVAQGNVLERDLGTSFMMRLTQREHTRVHRQFAAEGPQRSHGLDGIRGLRYRIGAHRIGFLPFSVRTWFNSERS